MKRIATYFMFLVFSLSSFALSAQDSLSTVQADSALTDSSNVINLKPKIVPFEELFSTGKIISSFIVLIFAFLLNRFITFLLGKLAENQASLLLLEEL